MNISEIKQRLDHAEERLKSHHTLFMSIQELRELEDQERELNKRFIIGLVLGATFATLGWMLADVLKILIGLQ